MSNEKYSELLEWGSIYVEDLLKQLYQGKNYEDMSEEEVNQMLEDLI